jgi:hypothetical protein
MFLSPFCDLTWDVSVCRTNEVSAPYRNNWLAHVAAVVL